MKHDTIYLLGLSSAIRSHALEKRALDYGKAPVLSAGQASVVNSIRAAQPRPTGMRPQGITYPSAQMDTNPPSMAPVLPNPVLAVRG